MSLSDEQIIKIIAHELAYHRFLGMIAIVKKNKQIDSLEESARASELANENWFLYKSDAEDLYNIITGKKEIDVNNISDFSVPDFESAIGSLDL